MRPLDVDFQIYKEPLGKKSKQMANYFDENVLMLTMYSGKPWADLTDPVIQYISTAAPSLMEKRTPLQDWLHGNGMVRTINSDRAQWKLRGTGEIQATALEKITESSYPGINHTQFDIKLDTEVFVRGDVLAPDIAKDNQVVVQAAVPTADGTGFIYTVQYSTNVAGDYFDPALLTAGLKWIKIDSVYGEASRDFGSFVVGGMSWVVFETELTDYGKTFEVTNKAHAEWGNLVIETTDKEYRPLDKGRYPDQIIPWAEAEFMQQIRWEKELRLFYGRPAGKTIIDPTSQYYRRVGGGLIHFLKQGNEIPYPIEGGSIDMFVEFLQAVWLDRVDYMSRNIVIFTGTGGLTLWEKWISEKYSLSPINTDFKTFVGSGKSFDAKNYQGLKFKTAYFTEYTIFPFGSLKVAHMPILDNMTLNGGLKHPRTGLPLSSYEFIIMDTGLGDGGGGNVELLQRADSEVYTYKCGTWSPLGPIVGKNRGGFVCSGPERSYQVYYAVTHGMRIKDVTKTAWFRPAVAV